MNHALARAVGRLLLFCCTAALLPGCAVVGAAASVTGAAVSVASTVVSTTVSVTGAVIEKTVEVATSDDPQP